LTKIWTRDELTGAAGASESDDGSGLLIVEVDDLLLDAASGCLSRPLFVLADHGRCRGVLPAPRAVAPPWPPPRETHVIAKLFEKMTIGAVYVKKKNLQKSLTFSHARKMLVSQERVITKNVEI
jgi:hypothetical protein